MAESNIEWKKQSEYWTFIFVRWTKKTQLKSSGFQLRTALTSNCNISDFESSRMRPLSHDISIFLSSCHFPSVQSLMKAEDIHLKCIGAEGANFLSDISKPGQKKKYYLYGWISKEVRWNIISFCNVNWCFKGSVEALFIKVSSGIPGFCLLLALSISKKATVTTKIPNQ